MKYKHIVFDIDGTLIDTEYAVLHSLQETIKGLSGREIPCSELRFALGITGTDVLKKLEIKDTSYAIELWDHQAAFHHKIRSFLLHQVPVLLPLL